MHAANPALAIEQATVTLHVGIKLTSINRRYTSDLSLTAALSSRNGTSALEEHPNGLKIREAISLILLPESRANQLQQSREMSSQTSRGHH